MHKAKGIIHWSSIAGMSPQSHCGDEDYLLDVTVYVLYSLPCACCALCVSSTNFCLYIYIIYIYIDNIMYMIYIYIYKIFTII